jgi:hypothetical protein
MAGQRWELTPHTITRAQVVADVASYRQFLPFCMRSTVTRRYPNGEFAHRSHLLSSAYTAAASSCASRGSRRHAVYRNPLRA